MEEDTTALRTSLVVNDQVIPLNEFTQTYIGNILRAITKSLGYESSKVHFFIESGDIKLFADDQMVPIKKEFVTLLVESTIKGVLSPLKGLFWLERISIATD